MNDSSFNIVIAVLLGAAIVSLLSALGLFNE
jgi:hypothetical protein